MGNIMIMPAPPVCGACGCRTCLLDMSISGKTLYTIGLNTDDNYTIISTYDITNPASPVLTNDNLITLPNIIYTTFTVSGDYIYIVNNITNAIDLYDITGKLITPNFITGLPTCAAYYPQTVRINNNNLYIVLNNSEVSYFALSPSSPTIPITESPRTLIASNNSSIVTAMTAYRDILYVSIGNIIYKCDISNSSSPKIIGVITGITYSSGLSVIGNMLYSSNSETGTVSQYILNGSTAILVNPSVNSYLNHPYGLLIYSTNSGNYLYIANYGGNQTLVTDIIQSYIYTPLVQRIGSMSTRYGNNFGKSAFSRPYYCNPLQMGDNIAIDTTCQSLALLTSQNSSQVSFRVLKSGYYNLNNTSSYLGTLNYT
jgi:hypothetical protein